LIAVLLVVVVLSFASYKYLEAMTAETERAYRDTELAQARGFAIAGVHYAAGALSDPTYFTVTLGGNPTDVPSFGNVTVGDAAGNRGGGRFALYNLADSGTPGETRYSPRFGVTDESGKLNLNAEILRDPTGEMLYAALMKLPNMTEDIADAIVDWLDADDTTRTAGAESADYAGQGYRAKNGPLNSIEELLLVRGVTPQLLFGNDRNRNGRLDPDEQDGNEFNRGWFDFLTAYGREPNVDSTGTKRVNIADDDLSTLYDQLLAAVPQEIADYVLAYRMFATATTTTTTTTTTATTSGGGGVVIRSTSTTSSTPQSVPASPEQIKAAVELALSTGTATSRRKPTSILQLATTTLSLPRAPGAPANSPTYTVPSPLTNPELLNQYLPIILDKVSLNANTELIPRININTAPREVLMTVPGMEETDADSILAMRSSLTPGDPATTTGAWLVTQMEMPITKFVPMVQYITGTSQTFRVDSLGYFGTGGPTARVEAVIDTNQGKPRIVYFRDLTELGRAYDPPR
jgi:type II secretory pathway component PulK